MGNQARSSARLYTTSLGKERMIRVLGWREVEVWAEPAEVAKECQHQRSAQA